MRPIQLFLLFIQHRLEVPRQQRLDVLDGGGSWQMFEQIIQIRVGLDVIDMQVITSENRLALAWALPAS